MPPIPVAVLVVPIVVVLFWARCWSALFCDELAPLRDVVLLLWNMLCSTCSHLLRIAILHRNHGHVLVAVRAHVQIRHHARDLVHQILRRGHDDRLDARIRHRRDLRRLLDAVGLAAVRRVAAQWPRDRHRPPPPGRPPPPPPPNRMGDWAVAGAAAGKTLLNSLATSTGLAYFRWNTRISVSASALLSTAWMISTRCRMFACVSVITIELPASLATIVACGDTNNDKSDTSCRASTNRMGMIYVTISSLFGMLSGSLPILTGMLRVLASFLFMIVSVRPSRMAA